MPTATLWGGEVQVNTYTTNSQYSSTVSLNDAGQFVVAWTSRDQDGSGRGVYAQRFRIAAPNEPPTIAADNAAVTVDEGDTAVNSGDFADAEGQPVTLTASIGTVMDNGDGTWSWSWDTSDGPDDSQVVTITATDIRGAATDATFDLTVHNVAPIITGVGDTSTTPGSPITITADITDPGIDTPLSIVWDMGDGTTFNGLTEVTHTYAAGGEYFASLTVTDTDGAQTIQPFRVVIAPPVTITATQTIIEESATIPVGLEYQVNTYTIGDQWTGKGNRSQSVAINDSGASVVAWTSWGQDGSSNGVFAQRYDGNGNPVGSEFQVNTSTASSQGEPSVAMAETGQFIIVWSGPDPDAYGIYGQLYDSSGNAIGNEFLVNTSTAGYQSEPSVSMSNSGDFIITWISPDQDGDNYGIIAQRYDSDGVPQGSEFIVNSYTADAQFAPTVSMAGSGNFVITWTSSNQDGDHSGIFAQRYDSDANEMGSEFQVNSYTLGPQKVSTVAMNDLGSFVIAWESQHDGSSTGIFAQRFDSNGEAVGSEFLVNTQTYSVQSVPSVAMAASGEFIITWESLVQDGSGWGIYAQRYAADGGSIGGEFRVNSTTASTQWYSSVALNDSGQAIIVWSSFDQDGDRYGVFAQRYSLPSDQFELLATIDNALPEDVVIPLTYTGTAIPDVDFEQVGQPGVAPTQIVIPAGETSGSVTIRNVADALDEDVESLSVHFGVPVNASLASADPIDVQLLDDDPEPAVFLASVGQTLTEQDLQVPVTVELSEVSGRDVMVTLSASGTATAGMDYNFDNPVVVIPAGQLQASTPLQLLDDIVGEGAEQIQVEIISADFATVPGTMSQPKDLTHLIPLNDTPTMQFASVLKQVSETDGTYEVLLTLSNESTSPITTTIMLSGDATVADDYTSALGTTYDVTFDPGQTEKTLSVDLVDNETEEPDETLLFQTTNLLGNTITHQARIIDDDSTFVTVTTTPAEVWEDTGVVTITATLSKAYDAGTGIDVLVPISFSGDLQNGVDFFADTNPILIPAGSTFATRGIALVDNDDPGTDEVITVNVGTPDNARLIGPDNVPVLIRDDDPLVSFDGFGQVASARTITVSETVGTVQIPVFLNKPVNDNISIPVSVYSTQMVSNEYDLVSARVQIGAGNDQGFVEIDINDDGTFEGPESLTVKLGTGASYTLGSSSTARTRTVRVSDNEAPPTPIWSTSALLTREGSLSVSPTLRLSHASAIPVPVTVKIQSFVNPTHDLQTSQLTLSSYVKYGVRFYEYSGTLIFPAGPSGLDPLPLSIVIKNDSRVEQTETYRVSASVTGGAKDTFDLIIRDNDTRQPPPAPSNDGGGGGGGGGGSSSWIPLPSNLEEMLFGLTATDGFVDGATVFFDANFNQVQDFLDANGNGVFDEGELLEPEAQSDYDGFSYFPSLADFDLNQDGFINPSEGQFVVRGGVDSSTGEPLLVPLVSPIGYSVASPLSTLVAAVQESQGLDTLTAEATVAGALSIPEQAYLRSNLIPLTNAGDAVAAQSFAASAQVYGTASQMASFISGLQGGVPTDLAGRLVFAEMASLLAEPGALLDLTEPVVIDSILRGAIARSGAMLPTGDELSTTVDAIVAINEEIAAVPVEGSRAFLESVAQIQVVANAQLPNDLVLLADGTLSSTTIQSTYLGAGLQQQIANSEIQNVVVPYVITSDAQIIEGDDGTSLLEVDVSLSEASNLPVTVNYATQDYTAIAGEDYDSIAGQLSWAAGETTTHTLQIPIQGDTDFEADEQFHLALTDAVNAAVVSTLSTLSIHNDDLATFTIASPEGDLDYLIEADSSGIFVEENGDLLFGGTLIETPELTLEGSAGVRNDFTFRAGLDAVSPVDGFRVVGASPDDTLTIDPQFARESAARHHR